MLYVDMSIDHDKSHARAHAFALAGGMARHECMHARMHMDGGIETSMWVGDGWRGVIRFFARAVCRSGQLLLIIIISLVLYVDQVNYN